MTRRTALLSIAAAALQAQTKPAPRKIQAVILTGRDDHDWRGATPLMRQYLDAAGIFETRIAGVHNTRGAGGGRCRRFRSCRVTRFFLLQPRQIWENSIVSFGNTFWLMKVGNARSRT